jgi:23S rRNA (uracil1939-C5)-methyltransferase
MPPLPGSLLVLDIEKPTAGGRMLGRHHGVVVLVLGAIPGERVEARIERSTRDVMFAHTARVLDPSPDRRESMPDWRCGGNVLAHVSYPRQLRLKAEIVRDAFARIAHAKVEVADMVGSPEQGYRMRARLHAREGRLGFLREGSHELCDAATTGQLLHRTADWVRTVEETYRRERLGGLTALEIAENIPGDERVCHLHLQAGSDVSSFSRLDDATGGLIGLSAQQGDSTQVWQLSGVPAISDVLHARDGDPGSALRLRRQARAFFQSNRFLLERLVRHVAGLVPPGPVVDLYAGVGLFGLALAAAGFTDVTLVEGDPVSGEDLSDNAAPLGRRVRVERRSVEDFLRGPGSRSAGSPGDLSCIVDPPRTGLSADALNGIVAREPARLIYVSCDVATLARDSGRLIAAGYEPGPLTGFDLFPNTAHVESVLSFARSQIGV